MECGGGEDEGREWKRGSSRSGGANGGGGLLAGNSNVRRCSAASWTCVLRSLARRDWLTCGLLPNINTPGASGGGRAGPDTSMCTTRAVRRPAMRPDPARLPVRRSTNDRQPMLLGPQRYAVAPCYLSLLRVVSCGVLLCSRAGGHARAQKCWDRPPPRRGVNYPTLALAPAAIGFEACFAVCVLCFAYTRPSC